MPGLRALLLTERHDLPMLCREPWGRPALRGVRQGAVYRGVHGLLDVPPGRAQLMILGGVAKQPAEVFTISVDFANDLAVGETVATKTVTARDAGTDADTSGTILSGSPSSSGSVITQKVAGGASGDKHILTYRITTSAGDTFEAEVLLSVSED